MASLRTSLVLVGLVTACGSSNQTGDNAPNGVGGSAALGGQTGNGGVAALGGERSTGGQSGSGGITSGSGGSAGSSAATTSSGGTASGSGGTAGSSAATTNTGGTLVGGGASSTGGKTSSGGMMSTGGVTTGLGGTTSTGGQSITAGRTGSGGLSATGGAASGGTAGASSRSTGGAGGSLGTGGQPASCGPVGTPDIWNLPKFPMATGPYTADWQKLGLAYSTPQWWRDAKFGAWAHWDPQSMPEQGDWYAYRMYQQGSADFNYQVSHFGDPGGANAYGYKDICHNWVIDQWDPNALMDLYVQMGAKFFMAMGSHHDNFDNWDSSYQPWNSVKVGVKKDIVGTWAPIARQKGMRFGIGFHNTPARTWGQWMPIRYTSDSVGPYDAMQTTADGTGKWWQGMNPADLY